MRSTWLAGIFNPLSIMMAILSVIAGLIAAWWLFPVGLLLWAVMVWNISRSPSLRMSEQMRRRAPLAGRFQRYFDRIERAQVSVFNTLASAPPETRRVLQPVQKAMDGLTDRVYRLGQSMTTLENYRLVTDSQSDLQAELKRIDEVLATADDPVIQKEYAESRYSLEQRVAKRDEASRQLDRVEAQLLSLASEVDSVVAEVIRLQAMGAEEAAGHVEELVQRLERESAELEGFGRDLVRL
jgi:archaellum component FlaC